MPPFHILRTTSRTVAAAVLTAVALTVAGCGGGDSSPAAAPSSSTATEGASPPALTTKAALGEVAGIVQHHNRKVFSTYRQRVLTKVGKSVDQWLDGAFVGVGYPRDSFPSAFRSFTASARHDARKQQRLMTNWELRNKIDGVEVKRRTVDVDVLAPRGHPAGATARVHLKFRTTGHTQRTVTVSGRLFLTQNHGAWQVFGYDVAKGAK